MPFPFTSNTRRFSLTNALRLAEAARKVYDPEPQVLRFLKNNWGFEKRWFFDFDDTQAFMCANREVILLVFRGTDALEDWQANRDTKLVPGPAGRIHRGFSRALDRVWEQIMETLEGCDDGWRSLWVAGHSLGGALAVLAAGRLIETERVNVIDNRVVAERREVAGVYTFGQPRVGDRDFADYFNGQMRLRTFRFVNDEDIVTRVPPRLMGYADLGTVRYIDRNGVLRYDNIAFRRWLNRSEGVAARSSMKRFAELKTQYPGGIRDHGMGYYVRYIRENLNASA